MIVVVMVMVPHLQPAFARAERIAQFAISDIRSGCGGALPLHMVVMTFLYHANFAFEPQHLLAVFAEGAVIGDLTILDLHHPLSELRDDLIMVVQIACFDELDVRMRLGHLVSEAINPIDQNAGEQEIREDDDALIAKARDVFEARFHQWEGDA